MPDLDPGDRFFLRRQIRLNPQRTARELATVFRVPPAAVRLELKRQDVAATRQKRTP